MRTPFYFCLLLLLSSFSMGKEGKSVSTNKVPDPVKAAVTKAIPDGFRFGYRLLDNGNYLGQVTNGRDPKIAEVRPDGSLVRLSEPVDSIPADAQKRVEAALKQDKVSAKPKSWQKITEAGGERVYFLTFAKKGRSTYEVRVGNDDSPATVSLIDTRLNNGKGPRVRISGGGSIVR